MTIPSLEDLVAGRVSVSSLRRIELDDLLGRDLVELDDSGLHRLLTGQVVMVTGAGGSIGAELCRQIARFAPAKLVLFEQSELALYAMEQELPQRYPNLAIAPVIGDVKNAVWVNQVMAEHRPAVVFHAAAYKHVPLMENENAWEAVRNNVLGTQVVAAAAQAHGVGKFVMISTDKAVNPTNVMGATKRLAEMACQAMQQASGTRFVSVRFGNVLGSSGSVIPKFQKQIEAGGPVTVTHPEITRYFMSIPEAAQLVLQAGLMGEGGEIFVLDMGEPVKIAEMAKLMIRLSGADENRIRIEFTGLRPGEKLYEELLADDESTLPTPHPKLRVAKARAAIDQLENELDDWFRTKKCQNEQAVKQALTRWVPEYTPQD
jgi:FlaA1/EpsC-like NDP-sugar epimerase